MSASYVLWLNLNVTSHWVAGPCPLNLNLPLGRIQALLNLQSFVRVFCEVEKCQNMYSCVCLYVMEFLERARGVNCKLQARGHVRVTIQQALNLLLLVVVVLPS